MSYRVFWDVTALHDLHQIWLSALDKESIEHVAIRINTELSHNPLNAGESRQQRRNRILFKYPLIVWFRIVDRLDEVHVLHVRRMRKAI